MATVITGLMTFIGRHTYYIISAMSYAYVIREFDDGDSRLEVSDYGGQVLSWAPAGRPSVIWRPGALMLGSGVPIRGGVPDTPMAAHWGWPLSMGLRVDVSGGAKRGLYPGQRFVMFSNCPLRRPGPADSHCGLSLR